MKFTITNIALALTFAALMTACGADGANPNAAGAEANSTNDATTTPMGCNVDDECSAGQTCQIGASKPGGDPDDEAACITMCEELQMGDCEEYCSSEGEEVDCNNCAAHGDEQAACEAVCNGETPDDAKDGETDAPATSQPKAGTCASAAAPVKKDDEKKGMVWAGTWIVELDYTATVDQGFGNKNKKTYEAQAFTVTISGDNSALTATIEGGYKLTGLGTDGKLSLNGDWPINDGHGKVMGTDNVNFPNNIQVKLDLVSDGDTASGSFTAHGGANGKRTAEGTVSFSR